MIDDPDVVPSGMPKFFPEQTARGIFAARNGLFLIDRNRLEAQLGGGLAGSNLLQSFTAHGRGTALLSEGVLAPAFGVEAGYYTVLVRSTETNGALTPLTHMVYATGFVLGTATGRLTVCNTDAFDSAHAVSSASGTPERERSARQIQISPGWYSVTVVVGIQEADEGASEGWVCAFLLDPQESRPAFTADVSRTLNFFAGGSSA